MKQIRVMYKQSIITLFYWLFITTMKNILFPLCKKTRNLMLTYENARLSFDNIIELLVQSPSLSLKRPESKVNSIGI